MPRPGPPPRGPGSGVRTDTGEWRRLAVLFALAVGFDIAAWGQLQAFTPL